MFDYLQQFNKLPKELREKVSSPAAMAILSSLENKYGISLAMLVIQIMIKQVLIKDLVPYLIEEMSLTPDKAQSLSQELQERLFFSVATYLGLKTPPSLNPEEKELQVLMKENGIILPSQELMNRCRQILLTYRKGIRTKIDVRAALEKPVAQGGLGLEAAVVDRLLRSLEKSPVATSLPQASAAFTDLVNKNEASSYDLKSALARGAVKPPAELMSKFKSPAAKLNLQPELKAPEKILALEDKGTVKENLPLSVQEKSVPPSMVVKPLSSEPKEELTTKNTVLIQPSDHFQPEIEPTPVLRDLTLEKSNSQVMSPQPPAAPAEKEVEANKFAPAPKSRLWSKLFKAQEKKAERPLKKISVSSDHLAEAVRAAAEAAPASVRPAASIETKTKMEDVRVRPKVMGPLEELRYLDLVNFRRLGDSPQAITDKIVMKIKLLEKDGYDRMVEGVQSWRQSPVNRIYVRLAQEAVAQGITLRDAVAARQAANKETLSMEEIEAIVAMNSRLMF